MCVCWQHSLICASIVIASMDVIFCCCCCCCKFHGISSNCLLEFSLENWVKLHEIAFWVIFFCFNKRLDWFPLPYISQSTWVYFFCASCKECLCERDFVMAKTGVECSKSIYYPNFPLFQFEWKRAHSALYSTTQTNTQYSVAHQLVMMCIL